jgi:hypothetical protein
MFQNYEFKFISRGKHIFVQLKANADKAVKSLSRLTGKVSFPVYFYHYQPGGHVAALHHHMQSRFFVKIDISNFYYSISRNRVAAALHSIGYAKSRTFAKWSCVKNPLKKPTYSLPIGFVQSPFLATLVILRSPIAAVLDSAEKEGLRISVYFDDFVISGDDEVLLGKYAQLLVDAMDVSNFHINNKKSVIAPSKQIVVFNCSLENLRTVVTKERVDAFLAQAPTEAALKAFEEYVGRVGAQNLKREAP